MKVLFWFSIYQMFSFFMTLESPVFGKKKISHNPRRSSGDFLTAFNQARVRWNIHQQKSLFLRGMLEILCFRWSIWEQNKWVNGTALLQSPCSYRKYHSSFCKTRVQRYLLIGHSGLFSAWKLMFLVCRVSLECNREGRACRIWLSHMPPAMCSHSRHYNDECVMVLTWKPLHVEEPVILTAAGPGGHGLRCAACPVWAPGCAAHGP